jgi:hypothetical protein
VGVNRIIVMALLSSALGFFVFLASPSAPDSAASPCIPDDMNWCPPVHSGPVASGLGAPDDTNW